MNDASIPFGKQINVESKKLERLKSFHHFYELFQDHVSAQVGTIMSLLTLLFVAYKIAMKEIDLSSATFLVLLMNLITQNLVKIAPGYNVMISASLYVENTLTSKLVDHENCQNKTQYGTKKFTFASQQVKNKKESEYISLLTNNIKSIESDYFGTKYDIIYGVVHIIAGIILAVAVDWRILLSAGIIFIVIYLIISSFLNRVETQTENLLNALDKYIIRMREFIHGFRLIVSSNLVQHTKEEMYKEIENVQENQAQLSKKVVNINIISQMLVSSVTFAFFGYTVYAVHSNFMSVGEIIFIISGLIFLLQPGMQILQCLTYLKEGNVALSEIDHDIFALSISDGKEQCEQEEAIITGNAVTFSYDANVVFKDVNFSLKDHKKYLVVGTSGCGKSTFLKLLLREISPLKGQMKYGNMVYDSICTDSLLRNITCMPQQCIIFDDTIRNNICMYRNVSEQEYRNVLEKTQLTEFVESFTEKDNHVLKDFGSNISGGEKARIALARTLLSGAKVLLLDEPFSNLDIQNVKKIEDILLSIEGRCIVNVSHVINEENVNRYDSVIRVEDGNIIYE
ncbi:MAG TPA: ABC transporter ATP-binding protein [Lachnospiraceae bacterium]|nr:ABC transporter ATP-binding protein [Lachnospiraceae bacterium]